MDELIDEIKGSFDRISNGFIMCEDNNQPSNSVNAVVTIGISTLVVALALVAFFFTIRP